MWLRKAAMALVIPALVAVVAAPALAQEKLKNITTGVGITQKLNSQLPLDAQFTDDTGRQIQLGEYFNKKKPVLFTLIYFKCPKLCGQVMNGTLQALRVLKFTPGQEFELVFISIDPTETPDLAAQKKRSFVNAYRKPESADGWHFLVGQEQEIKRVADAVGYTYKYDPTTKLYVHGAAIMVATPAGHVAQYFYGIEYSVRDLRLALVEASEEKIGSLVDEVLLFCLDYDPIQGKYGFVIIPAIRIVAIATMAALALFIIRSAKRDKRTKEDGDELPSEENS
ncbi:MAG: SCO family protein [Fimbriimonadales bacterium]